MSRRSPTAVPGDPKDPQERVAVIAAEAQEAAAVIAAKGQTKAAILGALSALMVPFVGLLTGYLQYSGTGSPSLPTATVTVTTAATVTVYAEEANPQPADPRPGASVLDMEPIESRKFSREQVRVNGLPVPEALSGKPHCVMQEEYNLDRKYSLFTASLGLDETHTKTDARVKFLIAVDGRRPVGFDVRLGKPVAARIPLAEDGAKALRLTLRVENNDGGWCGPTATAVWIDPRLHP